MICFDSGSKAGWHYVTFDAMSFAFLSFLRSAFLSTVLAVPAGVTLCGFGQLPGDRRNELRGLVFRGINSLRRSWHGSLRPV